MHVRSGVWEDAFSCWGPDFLTTCCVLQMEHVRLELLMRSDAFEKMASKLETLAKG